jgi:hypothetical protein
MPKKDTAARELKARLREAQRRARRACGSVRASRCVLEAVRAGSPLEVRPTGKSFSVALVGVRGVLARRPTHEAATEAIDSARELVAVAPTCPPCDVPLTVEELHRRRQTRVVTPQTPQGIPAHYAVVDVDSLVASHLPTSFAPDARYPANVQERQYHSDVGEQRKVVLGAQNLDPAQVLTNTPSALDGPPLVTSDGLVLGGNGRSLMLKRAYATREASADRYRAEAVRRATEFGLDGALVGAFAHPVIVRVLDGFSRASTTKQLSDAVRWLNEGLTQALDPRAKAVAESRQLAPEHVAAIGELLAAAGDASLRDVMRSSAPEIIRTLEAAGIITAQNRSSWVNGAELTDEAKDRLEGLFLGRVVGTADRLRATSQGLLQKLERAVPHLVRVAGVNPSLDVIPFVQTALDVLNDARGRGLILEDALAQRSMFAIGAAPSRPAIAIARLFDTEKPRALGERFRSWAAIAAEDPSQPSMFWRPPTASGALERLTGEKMPDRVANPCGCHRASNPVAPVAVGDSQGPAITVESPDGKGDWTPCLSYVSSGKRTRLACGEPAPTALESAIKSAERLAKKMRIPVDLGWVVIGDGTPGRTANPAPKFIPLLRTKARSTEVLAAELVPFTVSKRRGSVLVHGPVGLLEVEMDRGRVVGVRQDGRALADVAKALAADLVVARGRK